MTLIMTQRDIDAINKALASLAEFTEEPIVYQRYSGMTPGDKTEGQGPQRTYTADLTITSAITRELTLEEVEVSGGVYELGDREFMIRTDQAPSFEDRIDFDGARYRPKRIERPPLKGVRLWTVRAKKE